MGLCTLVARRDAIYQFRKRVPEELQKILGKKTIKKSLDTSDPNEAKKRKAILEAEVHQLFEATRLRLHGEIAPQAPAAANTTSANLEHMAEILKSMKDNIPPHRITFSILENLAWCWETDLAKPEWARKKVSDVYKYMALSLKNGKYDRNHVQKLVDRGIYPELDPDNAPLPITPVIQQPSNATPKGNGLTINDIFEKWSENKRRIAKNKDSAEVSVTRYNQKIQTFIQFRGNILVGSITFDDLLNFREYLSNTTNYKGKTINGYTKAVQAIVSHAHNERYISSHPFTGGKFTLDENDSEKYIPFEHSDLKALFVSPTFKALRSSNPAHFWIPLIALFTGARLEEIGLLKQRDILVSKERIFYFDINERGTDKKLKTKSSIRQIPIHPTLIGLGLIESLFSDEIDPDQFIFSDLVPCENRRTHSVSKWFGTYKRKLGINDTLKVFHSFRHTLKDACRTALIPEEMHQQLTGHSNHNVGRGYGYGYSIATLYKELSKVDYGLDFQILKEP